MSAAHDLVAFAGVRDRVQPFALPGGPLAPYREAIITAFNRAGLVICSIETGFEAEIDGETMAPLMGVARRL